MRKYIVFTLLMMLSASAVAQNKKIALLETLNGDKAVAVKGIEMNMVRGELRKAITNQTGYQAFTRTDIDQLMKEHGFQNSGMVSDAQRKKLGEMSGADYICVSTLTKSDTEFYLEAYLIDIESGEISNPASQYGILKDGTYANLFQICQNLAQELTDYVSPQTNTKDNTGSNNQPKNTNTTTSSRGQNFTETAFGINMKMVYVEGGSFTMGCTGEQGSDCESNESPSRYTKVNSFYIGMLEVTQSQWEKVMGTSIYQQKSKAGASNTYGTGPDYPMYYVSWEEAKEFCQRLSRQTGRTYRLPTEAEWEYAARGGNKNEGTKYSGGWSLGSVGWYSENSGSSTHPCGTKTGNALGIYDMSGNVWEWCEDWYGPYLAYDTDNPKGASSGSGRVLRGGGWSNGAKGCRVSYRSYDSPGYRDDYLGFRVVVAQ